MHLSRQSKAAACRRAVVYIVYLQGEQHRVAFHIFFHGSGALAVGLILISMGPTPIMRLLTRPWEHYHQRHIVQQHQRITYLHGRLLSLAPQVHLPVAAFLQPLRHTTEIGDARDIILSHAPAQPADARAEAHYFYQALREHRTIDGVGPYTPTPIPGTVQTYYARVARYLHELERVRDVIEHPITEP